jgi:hypothetical protein
MSSHARKPRRAKQLGVSDEDYARMLEQQDGKCAIRGCGRTPKTRRFHVDHDHKTGAVRGLLCHLHNRYLPKDSADAYRMFVYLARHEGRARDVAEMERVMERLR